MRLGPVKIAVFLVIGLHPCQIQQRFGFGKMMRDLAVQIHRFHQRLAGVFNIADNIAQAADGRQRAGFAEQVAVFAIQVAAFFQQIMRHVIVLIFHFDSGNRAQRRGLLQRISVLLEQIRRFAVCLRRVVFPVQHQIDISLMIISVTEQITVANGTQNFLRPAHRGNRLIGISGRRLHFGELNQRVAVGVLSVDKVFYQFNGSVERGGSRFVVFKAELQFAEPGQSKGLAFGIAAVIVKPRGFFITAAGFVISAGMPVVISFLKDF